MKEGEGMEKGAARSFSEICELQPTLTAASPRNIPPPPLAVADVLSDPTLGGSTACLNNVQSAFATLDAAMTGTVAQQTAMSNLMSSCAPAVTPNDAMWLASNVGGQIDGLVQYNLEGGVNPISVAGMCGIMTNGSFASPIQALAAVVKATLAPGQTCMDNSYTDFIAQLSNTTADFSATGVGMRQWTYMVREERKAGRGEERGRGREEWHYHSLPVACPTLHTLYSAFLLHPSCLFLCPSPSLPG